MEGTRELLLGIFFMVLGVVMLRTVLPLIVLHVRELLRRDG